MTDTQWAERITALAKDRVNIRTSAFESRIESAIREFLPVKIGYRADNLTQIQILGWYMRELRIHPDDQPKVKDEKWLDDQLKAEESEIAGELTAKLDIFGQLRKAKGEDWTPKQEDK